VESASRRGPCRGQGEEVRDQAMQSTSHPSHSSLELSFTRTQLEPAGGPYRSASGTQQSESSEHEGIWRDCGTCIMIPIFMNTIREYLDLPVEVVIMQIPLKSLSLNLFA